MPIFQHARFILPDGAPIIWFSKLLGRPLKKRLAGRDLFPLVGKASMQHQKKVFLVLPNEEVKIKLEAEYPSASSYSPHRFLMRLKKKWKRKHKKYFHLFSSKHLILFFWVCAIQNRKC
ncbi:MAG: WecB/TagA/CpsF family glycosyltransferase [Sphingobacteriales bacterium]|nr:WecB/TagA/CpsF family glycosyltransferase [Sphingobacteriales bacterium]